jgi:hypothetical protein
MRFSSRVWVMTNKKHQPTNMLLLLAASCLICFLGCEREKPTFVRVNIGPSFSFSGSGRLAVFTVYAPRSGEKIAFPDADVASVVWQIKASKGYFEGVHVEGFQLHYGKVPDGYTEVVPSQPQVAPPLPIGAVYSFFAETSGAAAEAGYFYVDKSGPLQVELHDPCLMLVNGHKVRVTCKTKEPYQEPNDLESFVRQRQITR